MKKSYFSNIIILAFIFFSYQAHAWDSMGHRVIAQIAYEHLDPKAKAATNQLVYYMADAYPYSSSFQTAAAWADYIKADDVHTFDNWHYDDIPITDDNTPTHQANTTNLTWAINQCITVLESPNSNQYEKAFFLRFLLHLTGDASQPLHCANRFSQSHLDGDEGGNLFVIKNDQYSNLHSYWDAGLGYFDQNCRFSLSKSKHVKCLAAKIQLEYPESAFSNKVNDLNPTDWVNESYQIANTFAYQTTENKPLSETYLTQGQVIVEKQIALSGYRLANLLNHLFG